MNIKGQNIRLFISSLCVAASTGGNFHISTKTDDSSNKDDAYVNGIDWDKVDIVGASWDAQIDALVLANYSEDYISSESFSENTVGTITMYTNPSARIYIPEGMKVTFIVPDYAYLYIFTPSTGEILTSSAGAKSISYISDSSRTVNFGMSAIPTGSVFAMVTDAANTLGDMINGIGNELNVELNTTTGTNNRTKATQLKKGTAYITDIKINAPNRQKATFTAQLTGSGPLT